MSSFRSKILHARKHRFKITGSLGMHDAYAWEKDNGFPNIGCKISLSTYCKIIRNVNKTLAEAFSIGERILLPEHVGVIHLKKKQPKTSIENGKLKTTLPIDWNRTLKLWEEDEESYKNRTLIRHEVRDVFRIYYKPYDVAFPNSFFVKFYPGHYLKQRLVEKARNNEVDAYNFLKE